MLTASFTADWHLPRHRADDPSMYRTVAKHVTFLIGTIASAAIVAAEPATVFRAQCGDADDYVLVSDAANQSLGAGRGDDEDSTVEPTQSANNAREAETAVFAGGCFWCIELVFEQLKGVIDVETGYCGGTSATADYDRVHQGMTRHAEAIRVTYDPKEITYEQLLVVFFDAHDPTQLNRQGDDDVGRQYRSAIFFANSRQKKEAERKIKQLQQQKTYRRRVVTKVEPLAAFYRAEELHQNFAMKNPFLPYIQVHAIPRACTVRMMHPELINRRQ